MDYIHNIHKNLIYSNLYTDMLNLNLTLHYSFDITNMIIHLITILFGNYFVYFVYNLLLIFEQLFNKLVLCLDFPSIYLFVLFVFYLQKIY